MKYISALGNSFVISLRAVTLGLVPPLYTSSADRRFGYHFFQLTMIGCLLVAAALVGQSSQSRTGRPVSQATEKAVSEAMTELKAGKANLYHIRVLGKAKTAEAIPYLEKEFSETTDTLDKALLAQVLVQLRNSNGMYWDFLANLVESALNTDAPKLFDYDAQGKLIPQQKYRRGP